MSSARLDKLESERPDLEQPSCQVPDHESRVAALEADRERHQKRASLIDQRDQATAEISPTAEFCDVGARDHPVQCAASKIAHARLIRSRK